MSAQKFHKEPNKDYATATWFKGWWHSSFNKSSKLFISTFLT